MFLSLLWCNNSNAALFKPGFYLFGIKLNGTFSGYEKVACHVIDNIKGQHNGVKIIGYANVPGRVAKDASALYAKNIFNFLSLIIDKENKKITFNWEDEIVNSVVLTNEGKIRLEQFN